MDSMGGSWTSTYGVHRMGESLPPIGLKLGIVGLSRTTVRIHGQVHSYSESVHGPSLSGGVRTKTPMKKKRNDRVVGTVSLVGYFSMLGKKR